MKKVYRFAVPLRFIEYFEIEAETLNEAECILTKKVQTEDKSDWNFDYMSASVDYPNIDYIVPAGTSIDGIVECTNDYRTPLFPPVDDPYGYYEINEIHKSEGN